MNTKKIALVIFISVIFIELGLQTFWLEKLNVYSRPIIYLFLSFLLLYFGYYFSKIPENESIIYFSIKINYKIFIFLTIIILGFIIYPMILDYLDVLSKHKIDPRSSDVIPSVEMYVKRFISGERVYKPLPMPGYEIAPDYVTFLWLPYIIPELIGFDYRMLPLIFFFIFIFSYFIYLFLRYRKNIAVYFFIILAISMLYYLVKYDSIIFARNLELTIAVFYMILSVSIFHKNKMIIVIGILLCLLSRYSLSFWLISYVLVILVDRGFKEFALINLYLLIGVLVFFIPFIAHDLNIFIEGLEYYSKATLGEWHTQPWQNVSDKPYTLSKGHGFAIYFYDFVSGNVEYRLKSLKIVHLILSVISGLSVFVIYLYKKSKIKDKKLFFMFALKFFLMVFYIFIQIPYNYLFVVPLLITIPIVGELIVKKQIQIIAT